MSIQFIDLKAQQARIKSKLDAAIQNVLSEGKYIMGPQVKEFEAKLAEFCGAKHAIGCANGTDALQLALMALQVEEGDVVFCPSFTFAATAEVIPLNNAIPFFVDIDPQTFNMDVESLKRSISEAKKQGLTPKGIIAVDLFGLSADYDAIKQVADEDGLWIIADSAQGFGATYKGKRTGSIGTITTTSFFPAKPLGCYGDGGAVLTNDDELASLIGSLQVHGKGSDKYDNVRIGLNSRLDTLQAAILLEKLAIYQDEIDRRQVVANRYSDAFQESNLLTTPFIPDENISVWAQYTLQLDGSLNRAKLQAKLKDQGVPSVVYYPNPLHSLSAYSQYPKDPNGMAITEDLAKRVLSLPMHPYLEADVQEKIITAVLNSVA